MMANDQLNINIQERLANLESEPQTIYDLFTVAYSDVVYPSIDTYKILLLCAAAEHGRCDVVRYLLDKKANRGFDVNYKYGHNSPLPLLIAVRKQNLSLVEIFVRECSALVHLEASTSLGDSSEVVCAAEEAIKQDSKQMLSVVEPFYNSSLHRLQRTLLHLAANHGALNCTEYLLERGSLDVNAVDKDDPHNPEGFTPLMLGAKHGVNVIRQLLHYGAQVDTITGRTKASSLQILLSPSTYTHEDGGFFHKTLAESLELLLGAGANANARGASGETPLVLLLSHIQNEARTRSDLLPPYNLELHAEILLRSVQILINHGANINDQNSARPPLIACLIQTLPILRKFTSSQSTRKDPVLLDSTLISLCTIRDSTRLLLQTNAQNDNQKQNITSGLLDSLCLSFRQWMYEVSETDLSHERIAEITAILLEVFVLGLQHGASLDTPSLLVDLAWKGNSFVCFLVCYLNTLSHKHYTALLLNYYEKCKHRSDVLTIPWQPVDCRSLKSLCRMIVFNCLARSTIGIELTGLPQTLIAYVRALHL